MIGETAIVGDNVSMLHHVTLGGSGTGKGVRHPVVGNGVLLGAGVRCAHLSDELLACACMRALLDVLLGWKKFVCTTAWQQAGPAATPVLCPSKHHTADSRLRFPRLTSRLSCPHRPSLQRAGPRGHWALLQDWRWLGGGHRPAPARGGRCVAQHGTQSQPVVGMDLLAAVVASPTQAVGTSQAPAPPSSSPSHPCTNPVPHHRVPIGSGRARQGHQAAGRV